MIFVDEARIFVKGGNGGRGCESFYQDKLTRYPRPDGGDGGAGGSIIVLADSHIQTLLDFKYKQHYQAERGGHASSKGKKGKTGHDCVLKVPVGTIVRNHETGLLIRDLTDENQSVIVARGGRGGIGNKDNRTPKPPAEGESLYLDFQLKIIADVGIVGFPNAGKSTLISNISKVRSKIANYPFTTRQPILGMVENEDFRVVVADLPGIIEGAHQGRGLGDKFLKHAERTKALIHLIDMAGSEGRDPLEDYECINHELKSYDEVFLSKPRIIVANKMDLPDAEKNLKRFKKKYKNKILAISAIEKKGLNQIIEAMKEVLC